MARITVYDPSFHLLPVTGCPDGEASPAVVYRLWDSSGRLLYVGVTDDFRQRSAEHAQDKYWWPQVARRGLAGFPSRELALAEEARAIVAEHPLHNRVGSPWAGEAVAAEEAYLATLPPVVRNAYRRRNLRINVSPRWPAAPEPTDAKLQRIVRENPDLFGIRT